MSNSEKHINFKKRLIPNNKESATKKEITKYEKIWGKLHSIIYDNSGPIKRIPKENLKEISSLVENISEKIISAYFNNDQKFMGDLVEDGLFVFNYFSSTLPPEKKAYFKLGELKGHISLMGRILSTMVARDQSLSKFNEIQKKFPYAKDIILSIGEFGFIEKKEIVENFLKNEDLENAITYLVQCRFVHEKEYGEFDFLSLSGIGKLVYDHYISNREDEIFYQY